MSPPPPWAAWAGWGDPLGKLDLGSWSGPPLASGDGAAGSVPRWRLSRPRSLRARRASWRREARHWCVSRGAGEAPAAPALTSTETDRPDLPARDQHVGGARGTMVVDRPDQPPIAGLTVDSHYGRPRVKLPQDIDSIWHINVCVRVSGSRASRGGEGKGSDGPIVERMPTSAAGRVDIPTRLASAR